ncbi:hypothetical protein SAMN05892873_10354 [Aeromonas veronii]|nr:hypothetical protein SAMN05892873_10354 [Aeromonas veronii]
MSCIIVTVKDLNIPLNTTAYFNFVSLHSNKQHWNTVTLNSTLPDDLWQGWVHHSYERVVAGLPKAKRPQAPRPLPTTDDPTL